MIFPNEDWITSQKSSDSKSFKIKYRLNSVVSLNFLDKSSAGDDLPLIKVIGTGGTIASKGSSASQTAGYEVDLTIEDLVNSIPDLLSTCNLEYEQVLNVDLKEIGTAEILTIHQAITKDVEKYDGFVITHGTDTMEETSFFLQLCIRIQKPIVVCGSMRPSSAISLDGPMNLFQAISIASSRRLHGRGVLIALNDRIGSGFHITKLNANSLDTFKSSNHGDLGHFVNNEIHYYFPPVKPLGITYFDLSKDIAVEDLGNFEFPEVPIIYAHQGLNNSFIELAVRQLGAKGLVFATMGAGSLSSVTNQFIGKLLLEFKIPIVYLKRSQDGMVPKAGLPKFFKDKDGQELPFDNIIAGGYLNPQKCRILLQLCLNNGKKIDQIRECFTGVYGG